MWTKPQGYAEIISPSEGIANLDHIRKEQIQAGITRYDSATCFHCGGVFHVSARMNPSDIGGMCKQCYHLICPKCLDKPCTPWEAQMDALENAIERRRAVDGYV